MKQVKLNLGCGSDIRKGFINIDWVKFPGVDRVFNLNKIPYPFKTSSVDYIYCSHILEHFETAKFLDIIDELWRISKPNAVIEIRVPHFSSSSAFHPDHKKIFNLSCFKQFDKRRNYYGGLTNKRKANLKLFEKKIIFNFLKKPLERLFNRFPGLYECNLAFIFQANELHVKLKVVKEKEDYLLKYKRKRRLVR